MEKRVLISRWLGPETRVIPIYDEASVSSARLRVREISRELNLTIELTESAALIASELTHNQLAHAKQGYFSVKALERQGIKGLEVMAADIGPGIEKPSLAFEDKIPTSGSLGAGLGAVRRIADEFEVDDRISEGTCVVARKFEAATAPSCEIAIMGRPYPGESISGDDGVFLQSESGFLAGVADGLGHGPEARQSSNRAIEALIQMRETELDQIVVRLDSELAGSRGCAMSIMRFIEKDQILESVAVGDVHSHLYRLREAHFFTSTPLILGERRLRPLKSRVERVPIVVGSVLIMFTDGLKSRTSLKGQLDVLRQPAIAIAQHLLENESRPDDDVLVLVARFRR
jgi:anti-sigma regulatory factor (Ser/Thr protein kinase)